MRTNEIVLKRYSPPLLGSVSYVGPRADVCLLSTCEHRADAGSAVSRASLVFHSMSYRARMRSNEKVFGSLNYPLLGSLTCVGP